MSTVLLWLAAGVLALVALIWAVSLLAMRRSGGAVGVDNDRDINDRHFAAVLRDLLRPALADGWAESAQGDWRFGSITMHRRAELVGLHQGDLELVRIPRATPAIVVLGNLKIPDGSRVGCDVWCTGNVTIGTGCTLRSLAADGSVWVGAGTRFDRWVDAGQALRLGRRVVVVAAASAGEELILSEGFRGARVAAPRVILESGLAGEHGARWERAQEQVARWSELRPARPVMAGGAADELEPGAWMQPQSICAEGRFWTGPGAILANDLICRGAVRIGRDSVVIGSIHAEGDLYLESGVLVTGNAACRHLTMAAGAVVAGAVHADGDAILDDGALIGLNEHSGGLAATGSIRLLGRGTAVARRVVAGGDLIAY